jgi:hypothetical protein
MITWGSELAEGQIVALLRQAPLKLRQWASGRTEPATKSAHRAIDEMAADLDRKNPQKDGAA